MAEGVSATTLFLDLERTKIHIIKRGMMRKEVHLHDLLLMLGMSAWATPTALVNRATDTAQGTRRRTWMDIPCWPKSSQVAHQSVAKSWHGCMPSPGLRWLPHGFLQTERRLSFLLSCWPVCTGTERASGASISQHKLVDKTQISRHQGWIANIFVQMSLVHLYLDI
jgi:hypothetical protein